MLLVIKPLSDSSSVPNDSEKSHPGGCVADNRCTRTEGSDNADRSVAVELQSGRFSEPGTVGEVLWFVIDDGSTPGDDLLLI